MSLDLLLTDLALWWAQTLLVAIFATAVIWALRLPAGKPRLFFWQLVLAICLLLPFAGARRHEVIAISLPAAGTFIPVQVASRPPEAQVPWLQLVLLLLAAGMVTRFVLLGLGFLRLRSLRRNSMPLEPRPTWSSEAEIRISQRVTGPVTFGIRRPLVLLPSAFPAMPDEARDAILCHEILHVRRRDWLFTVAEEVIRAILWFQPAIWWIVNEIQLAREQAVDAEVIEILNGREAYVDALLAASGARIEADLAPATLFLRKRHLRQRLISILKEHSMSKKRSISTLAASLALLGGACWTITSALPLAAAPQFVADAPGVTVNTNGNALLHRPGVDYPSALANKGVEGTVQLQVRLDETGKVLDAWVLSGLYELRNIALRSVLDWHFSRSSANTTPQIAIAFEAPKDRTVSSPQASTAHTVVIQSAPFSTASIPIPNGPSPSTVKAINVSGLPDEARDELLSRLPLHVGEPATPEQMTRAVATVQAFDEHLQATSFRMANGETSFNIVAPQSNAISLPAERSPVRVGGNVAAANLLTKVNPAYPPLAKMARVQGTVTFEALIGTDGHVQNLRLISGPPLLVQAAMEAAQQWVYKPTLLNGGPVTVLTSIDLNFTLLE